MSIGRGRGAVLRAAPPPYARSQPWLCPCLATCTRKVTASPPSTAWEGQSGAWSEGCGGEDRGPGPGGEGWGRGAGLGLPRRESEEDQALVLRSTSCRQDEGELGSAARPWTKEAEGSSLPLRPSLPSGAQKWRLDASPPRVPAAEPVFPIKWGLLAAPWAVTWAGSPLLPWMRVLRLQMCFRGCHLPPASSLILPADPQQAGKVPGHWVSLDVPGCRGLLW